MQTKTKKCDLARTDEELIREHQTSVWRFLRFLGAPAGVAEDLLQETFLVFLRRPPVAKDPEAVAGWLRQVAHSLFINQHRKLRRELQNFTEHDIETCFVELSGSSGGDEYLSALDDCMASLGRREQELLRLRFSEEERRSAIATQLDMSEEATKTLLRRVKEQLRRCIQRRLNDEPR